MASVQYSSELSSLVISLSGKFFQFSLGHGDQVTVSFVQFISKTLPALAQIDRLAQFGSNPVQSIESPIVWEEQRSSSRSSPVEIPARRSNVCGLGG